MNVFTVLSETKTRTVYNKVQASASGRGIFPERREARSLAARRFGETGLNALFSGGLLLDVYCGARRLTHDRGISGAGIDQEPLGLRGSPGRGGVLERGGGRRTQGGRDEEEGCCVAFREESVLRRRGAETQAVGMARVGGAWSRAEEGGWSVSGRGFGTSFEGRCEPRERGLDLRGRAIG